MFLDEHINRNFDKLNDNDLHIAHFINTHIDECKNENTRFSAIHMPRMQPFTDLHAN